MGNQNIDLSHEEVWDDTALIESWNDALAEYKKYHSLYTDGGTLRDLKQAQQSIRGVPNTAEAGSTKNGGEAHDEAVGDASEAEQLNVSTSAAAPPEAVLGSMKNQNLKKLLMSWYYAGYYTGLYEGQQQAEPSDSSRTAR